jgi:hypothetical protein
MLLKTTKINKNSKKLKILETPDIFSKFLKSLQTPKTAENL